MFGLQLPLASSLCAPGVTDSRRKSWQSSHVYFVCNAVWVAAVGEGQYSGRRSKDSLFLRVSETMSSCEIIYYVRDVNGCDWCYNTTTSVYQLATVN